jgi:hypothetical protein
VHALLEPLRAGAETSTTNEKSVVTKVAGFESGFSCVVLESAVTSMAGFETGGSVVTKVAAFARDLSPQLPGARIVIPDWRR